MGPLTKDAPKVATQKPAEAPRVLPDATSTAGAQQAQQGQKLWGATGAQQGRAPTQVVPGSQGSEIICPVLRAMVAEGRLPMEADGTVKLNDLRDVVKDLGGSAALGHASWAIGAIGNTPADVLGNLLGGEFNLKELPEGHVPHPADTGVLRGGRFDEAAFQKLVSHADANGMMTTTSFANAIADNYRRDVRPGNVLDATARGINFAEIEFAGFLAVFGKRDPESGETAISVKDLRTLYETGKFGEGMLGGRASVIETVALQASLKLKVDANLARHAVESLVTPTGLSRAGERLSEGGVEKGAAAKQASVGAGKAAACPYMGGGVKMPTSPNDVVNAHTQAGVLQDT